MCMRFWPESDKSRVREGSALASSKAFSLEWTGHMLYTTDRGHRLHLFECRAQKNFEGDGETIRECPGKRAVRWIRDCSFWPNINRRRRLLSTCVVSSGYHGRPHTSGLS